MSLWVGPLILDLGLLAAGGSLIYGLGLARTPRGLLRLAGLAFVLGWAVVGLVLAFFLMIGLAEGRAEVAAAGALVIAGSLVVSRLVRPSPPAVRAPQRPLDRVLLGLAALVAGGYLVMQLVRVAIEGPGAHWFWDAWAFWIPKAQAIFFFGGLDTSPGGFTSFPSPQYPPLLPGMDAAVFAAAGRAQPGLLPFQEWILAASFVAAVAGLLLPRVAARSLAPALVLMATAPGFAKYVGSGMADDPLAYLVALAGLTLLLSIRDRDPGLRVLAALLAAAAALTKQEGLPLALLVVLGVMVGLAASRERRAALGTAAVGASAVVAIAPWWLWLHVNHVRYQPDYTLERLLHPVWLIAHAGRLGYALHQVGGLLFFSLGVWLLTALLAISLSLLLIRKAPEIALFAPTMLVLGWLGFCLTYWIGRLPVVQWASTSTERVLASVVLSVAAMLPLLIDRGLRASNGQEPSSPASTLLHE